MVNPVESESLQLNWWNAFKTVIVSPRLLEVKQAILQHYQVWIEMDLTCAKFFHQTWQTTPLNYNTNYRRDDEQEIS